MFRGIGLGGLAALAIVGFMLADGLAHPKAVNSAGGTIAGVWKTTANAIRG